MKILKGYEVEITTNQPVTFSYKKEEYFCSKKPFTRDGFLILEGDGFYNLLSVATINRVNCKGIWE